jgi:thioredoxin 1
MSGESIRHVIELNEYQDLIGKGHCVVKFTATWCGPCRAVAPVFNQLALENAGTIKCLEVDIDNAQDITNFEDVKSIPYFVFYVDGSRLDNLSMRGSNKDLLLNKFTEFLSTKSVPKEQVVVQTLVVPPQGKILDMSRLTLDDISESEDDSEEYSDEENQEEDNNNNNEYGEDLDVLTEKNIPDVSE